MPTFHCTTTSVIPPDRFVFSGRVLAGEIEAGMRVLVPLNSSTSIGCEIVEVGMVQSDDSGNVGLIVRVEDEGELDFLTSMNVRDEQLEIE